MSWKLVKDVGIGGLINVGFVADLDLIIVVSHNGRGIFDCSNGEKLARDDEELWNFFDDETGVVEGFDFLSKQKIQTSGLFAGDKLAKETEDDWNLKLEEEDIILFSKAGSQKKIVGDCKFCDLRAFGFSKNCNYFVVATSCSLVIYKRKND